MASAYVKRTAGEFEDRARTRARWLRRLLTILYAGLATALAIVLAKVFHIDVGQAVYDRLIGKDETIGAAFKGAIVSAPTLAAFGLFAYWAWHLTGATADRLATESFGEFRTDLFNPIDSADEAQPQEDREAAIFKPPGGNAETVFDAVVAFARAGSAKKHRWITFHRADDLFAWTVLTGQSGAGKTALAKAAARELASDGATGTFRSRLHRARAWLREELAFVPRDTRAPWDIGKIRGIQDTPQSLRDWKPRRPTLLLLEEPAPGVARDVIVPLCNASGGYRKPVRLLFVNQTLPSELLLSWSGERPVSSQIDHFRAPPPVVEQFGAGADESALKGYMLHVAETKGFKDFWQKLYKSRDFGGLFRAIEGNPLLAGIAVELIEQGVPIVDLASRNDILDHRARQVIEKLDLVGLKSPADRKAIAVATLAQGPKWDKWSKALDPANERTGVPQIERVVEAFPYAPETPALVEYGRRLVHDVTIDAPPVPYLRPDLVGESVLNIWATASGPQMANALASDWVATAWNAGGGVFNSVQRRKGQRSALALALSQPPDRGAFPDGRTYVSVLFDGATRSGWALDRLSAALADIGEADLAACWDLLRAAIHAPSTMRGYSLACLSMYVRERAGRTDLPPLSVLEIVSLFTRVLTLPRDGDDDSLDSHGQPLGEALAGLWSSAALDWTQNEGERAAIYECVHLLKSPADSAVIAPLLARVDAEDGTEALHQIAHAWADVALGHSNGAQGSGAAAARSAAQRLDKLAVRSAADSAIQESRARAWASTGYAESIVPHGARADAVRDVTTTIAAIARSLNDNENVLTSLVRSWKDVAYAEGHVPGGTRAAAAREAAAEIDSIAEQFPRNSVMQLSRSVAWKLFAFAESELPGGLGAERAIEAARQVEAVARLFPDDEDIQVEQIHAWVNAALVIVRAPLGAFGPLVRSKAAEMDAIAKRYPSNQAIQHSRIHLWSLAVQEENKLPDHRESDLAMETARYADAIARPYAHDEGVQIKRAQVWENACIATANAFGGPRIAFVIEGAEQIDRIAGPWPRSDGMQLVRLVGWKLVAFAAGRIGVKPDVAMARAAAKRVDEIATPFPHNELIQLHRAAAWENLLHAELRSDHSMRRETVRDLARNIESIASQFPTHKSMQHQVALAWKQAAWAESEAPLGARAQAVRELANKVDSIASPFAHDEFMQTVRSEAWARVGYAESQVPFGAQSAGVLEAARRVEDIVRPFPSNSTTQATLAFAWHYACQAESEVRGGARMEVLREASARVDAIAAAFPAHFGILEMQRRIKDCVSKAEIRD